MGILCMITIKNVVFDTQCSSFNLLKKKPSIKNARTLALNNIIFSRENKDPDEDSYECSSLEIQSLTTALSLMSYLVVQDNVRTSDWRALQSTLGDLEVLATSHRDINVRKMSEKLKQVIATHGAVLVETDFLKAKAQKVNERPNIYKLRK